ncbi:MAG: hypothetical protein KatS3mg094_087 [Candidatus Parcubacteria bacterium]|nr:MAG: hypothetical protein KatS3mg094_087 [Candidatus Parcubacteria bacterium]
MPEKSLIENILKESLNAPSGSNSQPWEFIASQNTIKIRYLPEKDHPILNYNNRGTLIACGALIENIVITAKHYKLNPIITINEKFENNIIASIILEKSGVEEKDDLYEYIKKRTTNRNHYKKEALTEEEKKYLLNEVNFFSNCKVSIIEGDLINEIGSLLAYDTYLNFNNDHLRKLLFNEIIFDKEKAQKGERGLYIKTMEFKPPQILMIKLLRNTTFFKLMKKLGIVRTIYKDTVKMYSATNTMIGFSIINNDKEFINLGRLIENIWLRATKLNLACHLITGIFFFWQQANFGNKNIFNEEELNIINNSYQKLCELFKVDKNNYILTAVMRIGKADPPSAISVKKPPFIQWET